MKAIILCAGYGKRMKPLTDKFQKVMLPIYEKPLLAYIIEGLKFAGFKEIVIVVGYLKEQIINYFKDGREWGVKIEYKLQDKLNGTGGAVLLCEDLINQKHFFLTWGDILVPYKIYKEVHDVFKREKEDYILVTNYLENLQKGCAIYCENDYCTNMIEKPPKDIDDTHLNNCGIFILSTQIFNILRNINSSKRGEIELTEALNNVIKEKKYKVRVIKMEKDQFRGDFGDLNIYNKLIKDNKWIKELID